MSAPTATLPTDLDDAVRILRAGGVIAYPTEAVWGLGCDPFNEAAVRRLLGIKQRSVDKGLILIAGALAQLDAVIDWTALPAHRRDTVLASWPGPHTWLVPATAHVPRVVTGDHDTVAVRVSAHPNVISLCQAFAGPLVSTSANRAGEPPATTRDGLTAVLLGQIDAVLDGEAGGRSNPSTIRDALTGATLRA